MGSIIGSLVGLIGGPLGIIPGAILGLDTGLLGSLLGLGPDKPKSTTAETTVKISRPPRVSAYGRRRLFGAYCLFETASNGTAVDVYAVHDGRLDGIEVRYLGDDVVTVSGAGVVAEGSDGRYRNGSVSFYATNGATPGAGLPAIASLVPSVWSSSHRGDGVVLLAVTSKSVKAKNFQETYPQSRPPEPSIVARWQRCPDPAASDPLDESGWTWTENGVRQLLHYMLVREGPRPALPKSDSGYAAALASLRAAWWARRIAPTLDYWIAAAADCDSPRALEGGGTEPRYRSCVVHKHTDPHKTVKDALLATFDGWLSPRADGAYVIYSGRYYEPTVSIGPSEIINYTWEGAAVDDDEAANEIICGYISSEHDYNSVEAEAVRDEASISARGVLSYPLDLEVPSHVQVRALAKRLMARKNTPQRGRVTTNIAGRAVRAERFINLHLEEAGTVFYSGPVEIVSLSRNLRAGVTFEWVAVDPAIDDPIADGAPAPPADRVPVDPLDAPAIDSLSTVVDSNGVRFNVISENPGRDDITWVTSWRVAGEDWGPDIVYGDAPDASLVPLLSPLLPTETDVEVRVAYRVGDGRLSPYATIDPTSTSTAGVAPASPTDLGAVDSGVGSAEISWRNPVDSRFSFARVLRHTSPTFSGASDVFGDVSGSPGALVSLLDEIPTGTYYYWVTAHNATGTASSPAGPVSVTVSSTPP